MKFKTPEMMKELEKCPIWLRLLANDMDDFCTMNFGKEIIVTRVLEKVTGESGVHQDARAFDVRGEYADTEYFKISEVEAILAYLNTKYKRHDGLRTAIYHSFLKGPKHFHVQIAHSMDAYKEKK